MSVESDLESFARRIAVSREQKEGAPDDETRRIAENMKNVLLMNAAGLVARSPEALKAKAQMVWDEDWIQNPTSTSASFVRSLLRDLLQWEP